ncbi:neuropeptide CCHamide-2 receptor isoform X1 [Drosophila bipectinata]|uniref:neuropeptide CCHamide-2 receptor isoform X1 n=1 Tax=Drosophila bipectinata TaxID=42026 RepID=UPI001C89B38B|nr:neuropeptide CCHamide-2 receptor isoform X1 [Drosophila bipectinata]
MSALMDMSQTLALSLLYAPPDATGGVSPNIISIGSGNGSDGGGNDSSLGLATGQQGAATAVGGVLGLGQHNASADGGGGPYVPVLERPETYIVTVLYTLIFIVGVLGNGTLVIIFFRHRSMRNIPNTYILSLALADLLVILVCVPVATIVYTQESWPFERNMCRISEFFKDISIGVSVFTLTALSGERYCAIVNPLRKLQTKPLTVFTAAMIWVLAILLGMPSFLVSNIKSYTVLTPNGNMSIEVCDPFRDPEYAKYMVAAKASIYYLLPLSIIGALYIMMAKRLHISARDMPGEQQSMQSRSQARARRHVARMVVAFVVVFFICFFPYHVFELWYHFYPTAEEDFDEFWNVLRIVGFCTSFLNSCVNPVALYCVSGVFRQHFNRYLCCFCVKRQPHLRQHSTATGIMDNTSVMSMRRSTYVGGAGGNLRASMHRNSNHGGGGGSGLSAGRGASFHGGDSMPMQHSNGHGAAGGTLGGAGVGATGGPSSGRAAAVGEKR